MKHAKIVLLLPLLFLTACNGITEQQPASTANHKLDKSEQKFAWWEDRKTPFGDFEYRKISEKEAQELMDKKFKVTIPDNINAAKKLIAEDLAIEGSEKEADTYSIYSSENTLAFSCFVKYKNKAGKYLSYGEINLTYNYIPIQKKVKLSSEKLVIYNASDEGIFHGGNAITTLKNMGSWLDLADQDKLVKKFEEESKAKESLINQEIILYRNLDEAKEKRLFGKSFGVKYGANGIITEIYAVARDYRI
ncbi:hypothetical protein UAW_01415 [Enterococcus haemoperoxidus ATCC BAA-382]|uniref:Lipoprotein n=1 Tax=Enterococcus haemoperoxidus ATCC BAA-382 TaxID=1158608 RepID=R2TDD5_9ENTE|nr:hypothetical protein [Enterococcus haemoperoxidus]EOH98234.1 hypothetical protein UAW_01415 [Enterococcus haemoperoxidus ATCC BAA-382]EOT59747.1 hypothetical protein I583_02382 [Enterococcus haemoperoxidus ATCC BAA-382]OJG55928.1 hypothetical protein RV06_GL000044 [Enterococcus haemoperoxidus]